MIDTHCHLSFDCFKGSLSGVIESAEKNGITHMITVSTTSDSLKENQMIADKNANVFCTAGIHPLYSDKPIQWNLLEEAIESENNVAWGEIGLDNHYSHPTKEKQLAVLRKQLKLIETAKNTKPIIVHCRKAFNDLIPILKSFSINPKRYVFHCFTGTKEEAKKVLSLGAMISFTGIVTFPSAQELLKISSEIPIERLMIETDSPFLTPTPNRGKWPCKPSDLIHTAKCIAKARGISTDEFVKKTDENAKRFFTIE